MMMTMMAQGTLGGALFKRAILLLALAVVAATLATTAAVTATGPASAAQPLYTCINESTGQVFTHVQPGARHILVQEGFTCGRRVS